MSDYFTQLPVKIDMLDPLKMDLTPKRSFNNKNYYSSINNTVYNNYLNSLFKELNPRDIVYCEFPGAWPHIDHDGTKCAINHYYVTQNVETVYYEPGPNGATPFAGIDEEASCFFKKEELIETAKFCAEPDTLWLLDVTKIHSLEFPVPGVLRTFVKWRIDIPYNEVYDILYEKIIPRLNK